MQVRNEARKVRQKSCVHCTQESSSSSMRVSKDEQIDQARKAGQARRMEALKRREEFVSQQQTVQTSTSQVGMQVRDSKL